MYKVYEQQKVILENNYPISEEKIIASMEENNWEFVDAEIVTNPDLTNRYYKYLYFERYHDIAL